MNKKYFLCALFSVVLVSGCGNDAEHSGDGTSVCGDSVVAGDERCDDGNTVSGDGCSWDCLSVESGCECLEAGGACHCSSDVEPEAAVCGDGKVSGDEKCDDGNQTADDGCSGDCLRVESGFKCPESGGACHVLAVCGDGEISGDEACDDGNAVSDDGCSEDCARLEDGYVCKTPGMPCAPVTCGDGLVDAGEKCDKGEANVDYASLPGACSTVCQLAHYCGDGLLDKVDLDNGEECDVKGDTSSEYNGCTFFCKRVNYCGDGRIQVEHEKCDDGNAADGDGCSADCLLEDGFLCSVVEDKSVCSPILCGNGVVDAENGEKCDDGNRSAGDGCSAICLPERGWACTVDGVHVSTCEKTCGNGVIDIENGETCDDGNEVSGDGCSSACGVEPGYVCSEAGKPCLARSCGDGIVAAGEDCDDGNTVSKDGCTSRCKRESGWHCGTPGAACQQTICGDGFVEGDETCDEGQLNTPENKTAGCDTHCQTVLGWKCEQAGQKCVQTVCGDGILEGAETCEEVSEGCLNCVLQPGYRCEGAGGTQCVKGSCGDGRNDVGEVCDDGNTDAGDGCSPLCQPEPIYECVNGVCKPTCGDGLTLWEAGEECDDGNLTAGDGCSPECKIEAGYACTKFDNTQPDVLKLPIIYRDFRAYSLSIGSTNNPQKGTGTGYFTQAAIDALPAACKSKSEYRYRNFPAVGTPIPDFQGNACYSDHVCKNAIYPTLDADGRPMLRPGNDITSIESVATENCQELYTCPEVFAYWYRDTDMSITIRDQKLTLSRQSDGSYRYSSQSWWPLASLGFKAPGYTPTESYQGLFTSEFQSYFKYQGNETLTFSGDDDVWVFFNGKLAIELAGIHGDRKQSITLTPEVAERDFQMYPGGIYSLQMFHAERCNGGSTYTLTMTGFINMGTSSCDSVCGDGIVRGAEECDYAGDPHDTALNQQYGCKACKMMPYCGNGRVESGEGCDTAESWCEACKIATCGNGTFESEHEQCDLSAPEGEGNVHTDCLGTCLRSGCGDGTVDEAKGEECDDGNLSDEDMCTHECKRPVCGDGIVSAFLGEACDDGINDGSYGGCGFGCGYAAPRCGDGIIDTLNGEECDDGEAHNLGGYGVCSSSCRYDARCGDGIIQAEYEACDDGAKNGQTNCSFYCQFSVN